MQFSTHILPFLNKSFATVFVFGWSNWTDGILMAAEWERRHTKGSRSNAK